MPVVAHLDYEARSGVDITEVGSHRLSIDPRFEILMASVSRDDEDRVYLWVNPKFRTPDMMGENEEAERILAEADLIWAHNAQNEQANTWGAIQQKKACPFKSEPPLSIWRCSAAVARKAGLPYSLEQLCDTLQLPVRKDRRGKALIRLFCIPDLETGKFNEPKDFPEEWYEFGQYCCQDTRAEKAAGKKLKAFELSGAALATFQFDMRMNQCGIPINVAAARNAQKIIDEVQSGVTEEFRKLTGLNPTQREKIREMLGMENMQSVTVESAIELLSAVPEADRPPQAVRNLRILEMYQKVSYAAVKKIQTMLDCVCPDGIIRGMFMYYGAGTGRWCLTGDHEVLTFDGWKRIDEWAGGHIACWSPNETISFQKAKQVNFPFKGLMYHQKSQRIDQIATGDHVCPGWNPTTGVFEPRKARDMVSGFCIPYTGTRDKTARGINPDELRLLVATQADGHYTKDGALRFHFKRERKIIRLKELLRRTSIKWSALPNADGSTTISILSRHLPLFLHLFREKTFGAWILDVNAEVFFEELELWDGYRAGPTSIQYSTVNKTNAEWIQALAHTSGMATSFSVKRTNHAKWQPSYVLSIWLAPSNRNQLPSRPAKIKFTGTVYCAETTTGFFLVRRNGTVWVTGNSAQKLQPHNFKRTPPEWRSAIDGIYQAVQRGWSPELINQIYGDPLEMLSIVIRSFIHDPQYEMLDGDFNAVEARIVCWLAGEEEALEEYRRGVDRYQIMATSVYDRDLAYIQSLGKDSTERTVGKHTVLGCGFGMGRPEKFMDTCWKQGGIRIDKKTAVKAIAAYRQKHKKVVAYWWRLDEQCKNAVRTPGVEFGPFVVRKIAGINYLLGKLPSGRSLAFPDPKIELFPYRPNKPADDDITDEEWENYLTAKGPQYRENATYWGNIQGNVWGRVKLYGGKLAENFSQAVAADFMAHGAITAESRGMAPFMLVHDQGLALRTGKQTTEEYEAALGDLPVWAKGFPMRVEAKIAPYFRK